VAEFGTVGFGGGLGGRGPTTVPLGAGGGGGAGLGGAIFNMGADGKDAGSGRLAIVNSTLTANFATGGNGGAAIDSSVTGGDGASGYGGGLFNLSGNIFLLDDTFDANSVQAGQGGSALDPSNIGNNGNSGQADGGSVYNLALGHDIRTGAAIAAALSLQGSLLAASTLGTGTGAVPHELVSNVQTSKDTAVTTFTNANLVMTHTTLGGATEQGSSTQTASPRLGPLTNNGGLTPTMAVPVDPSNPAYQKGLPVAGISIDQRGVARGSLPSLGAFEAVATAFSGLSSPSISYGTASTKLSGHLSAGPMIPTGNVSITLDGVTQAAALNSSGNFSTTFATTALGVAGSPYTVTYSYTGTGAFSRAQDTASTLTITPATLTIMANNDSKVHGTLKTFGGTTFAQTGLVTANGDTIIGVTETSTGAPVSATVGSYAIVPSGATGSGLGNYTISYVNGTLTITPAPTSVSVSASSAAPVYGQSMTFTATVTSATGATPTSGDGTVTFYDGGRVLGTATLLGSPATATLTTAALAAGAHAITVRYSGDSNFTPSRSVGAQSDVPAKGIGQPWGVAVDGQGDVFIADFEHNRVVEVKPDGSQTTVGSGLLFPESVAVDGQGDVFIGDAGNHRVVEVKPDGTQTPVASGLSANVSGVAVAPDPLNNKVLDIFIADSDNSRVLEVKQGRTQTTVTTVGSGLSGPTGVAVDGQGDVFIADFFSRVVEVKADGTQTTVGTGLTFPYGVAVDGMGDVLIADYFSSRVVEVAPDGTQTTVGSGLATPQGVAVDSAGDVFIANTGRRRVVEVAAGSLPVTVSPALASITVPPYGVSYDGNAYTATSTATGVGGVDLSADLTLTGTTHTNAGTYTDTWTFHDPSGNYQDASGAVNDTISPADAQPSVTGYSVTYDGDNHTAQGTATDVNGNALPAGDFNLTATTHTTAGTYSADAWSFHDPSGNYQDASGTVINTISQATPTVSVSDAGGTYNGNAFSATDSVAGVVAGVDTAPASTLEGVAPTLTYYQGAYTTLAALNTALAGGLTGSSTAPSLPGSYTVEASFAGSTDYSSGQAIAPFTIKTPTTSITGPSIGVSGQPLTYTFKVNGPTQGIVFTINYGDGTTLSTSAGGPSIALDHLYHTTNTFTIQVTAKDSNGVVSQLATHSVKISTVAMESDPSGGTALAVGGKAAGGDTILVTGTNTSATAVSVTFDKTALGTFTPTGHILVYGQGGKDTITLKPDVVGKTSFYIEVPAMLYGEGSGGDHISAAGSAANNVLTGHGSNELLTGGRGRDLLIAGTGAATLNAGAGDDILIGGSTNYDIGSSSGTTHAKQLAALDAIMAEWGSADSYTTRVNDLLNGGGGKGSSLLNTSTVHQNGRADTLFGTTGSAFDWFVAGLTDVVKNKKSGEVQTTIS
jgi:hypothetical protein